MMHTLLFIPCIEGTVFREGQTIFRGYLSDVARVPVVEEMCKRDGYGRLGVSFGPHGAHIQIRRTTGYPWMEVGFVLDLGGCRMARVAWDEWLRRDTYARWDRVNRYGITL